MFGAQISDQDSLHRREGAIEQLQSLVEGYFFSNSILSSVTVAIDKIFKDLLRLSKVDIFISWLPKTSFSEHAHFRLQICKVVWSSGVVPGLRKYFFDK